MSATGRRPAPGLVFASRLGFRGRGVRRLADQGDAPYILFVCQNQAQRDDFLMRADQELTGHRWHPSHPTEEHQYVGRRRILFCDERDIHHRQLEARRLPPYPPGHPARTGSDAEIRAVRLPGGLPSGSRVAASCPEGSGAAKAVAARTGANATLGPGIGEAAPGNAENLRRTQAETESRRPGPAALEGIPVPATSPSERADTAI